MSGNWKDTTMTHFSLRKETPGTIDFTGIKLADQSSKDHPKQERWTEIRIYRKDDGAYISETVGRSIIRGERDRVVINVVPTAHEVASTLERKKGGNTFLTDLALDALDEAARNDPTFNEPEVL